jgi:hypothetical protein
MGWGWQEPGRRGEVVVGVGVDTAGGMVAAGAGAGHGRGMRRLATGVAVVLFSGSSGRDVMQHAGKGHVGRGLAGVASWCTQPGALVPAQEPTHRLQLRVETVRHLVEAHVLHCLHQQQQHNSSGPCEQVWVLLCSIRWWHMHSARDKLGPRPNTVYLS